MSSSSKAPDIKYWICCFFVLRPRYSAESIVRGHPEIRLIFFFIFFDSVSMCGFCGSFTSSDSRLIKIFRRTGLHSSFKKGFRFLFVSGLRDVYRFGFMRFCTFWYFTPIHIQSLEQL